MSEINVEARDRYYAEVSLKLSKAGFVPQPQEDGYLPVDWNGSRLCRLTANGGVQYREEHMERSGGRDALPDMEQRNYITWTENSGIRLGFRIAFSCNTKDLIVGSRKPILVEEKNHI